LGTRLIIRLLLSVAALIPYWRLLTLGVVFIPDDLFASDLFDGELPVRLLVGRVIRAGSVPLWTNQLCSGTPLIGLPADPLGLVLFTFFPAAPALDLYLVVLLLVAAHGAYSLARRFGADRTAAFLAGVAFAGSGQMVGQLKHLSILSTIVWLPVGLVLIDRAVAEWKSRQALWVGLFGLVFAYQVLSGFPQSAYICALFYGAFALFRVVSERRQMGGGAASKLLAALAAAVVVGAAAGAVVLLPLSEIAGASNRPGALDYRWATYTSYWPPDLLTFFVPYVTGDVGNATYEGPQPFSESYAYAGLLTALLAVYSGIRERRRPLVSFLALSTIIAFALMLGARSPFYYAAYLLIPGMKRFRAPVRFVVVLQLTFIMLGALGLTRVRAKLERRFGVGSWIPVLAAAAVCAITSVDLLIHQPRQNPMVPAREWLAPPATVDIVRASAGEPRTFTPQHRVIHRHVYDSYHGWIFLEPYFALRDLLEPNLGSYWSVPAADCYVGLPSRWHVDAWGYHYFPSSLMSEQAFLDPYNGIFDVRRPFVKLAGMFGVTTVLSPYATKTPGLTLVGRTANAFVYRVDRTARVRVVGAARRAVNEDRAGLWMRDPSFDPTREVILMDGPGPPPVTGNELPGHARIARESGSEILIDADAPANGYLVLSDQYYPGWRADIDGVPTPIYRANVSVRAVALPAGRHTVRFVYHPSSFFLGVAISLMALCSLFVWVGVAGYRAHA
jgi:hypothetical protein